MSRPIVGSEVVVVCRGHGHKPVWVPLWNRFTPSSPETVTYKGTVKQPDHWLKSDEFNLTTDIPHFPVRTINLTNVISINGVDVKQFKGEETKIVKVPSSKGGTHDVTVRNGVAVHCTCTGFHFRQRCSHLTEVK